MAGFKKCPKCGERSFKIQALQSVEVWIEVDKDDPEEFEVLDTEQNGDTEWTDDDRASCAECDWEGNVKDIELADGESYCRVCDELYQDGGDGFDGCCGNCADRLNFCPECGEEHDEFPEEETLCAKCEKEKAHAE